MGSRPQSSRAEASRRGFAQRPSPCLETTRHGNARPYCGPLCSPLQPRQGEMARRAEEDIICRTPKRRVPCRSKSPTPNRKPMTVRLRSRTIPTAIPHRCAFAKRLRPHRSGAQSENAPGRPGPMNAAVDNRRSRSMEQDDRAPAHSSELLIRVLALPSCDMEVQQHRRAPNFQDGRSQLGSVHSPKDLVSKSLGRTKLPDINIHCTE